MIRISSPNELLQSFRPMDVDQVQVSKSFKFPMTFRDYLSWLEPSGHRVYLIYQDENSGGLRGIVFERTHGSAEASPAMCQWCHAVRGGHRVSLLSATAGKNRRVGVHLCTDLNCRDNVFSSPGINDFHEGYTSQERMKAVLQRMNEFAKNNLF